MSCLYTLSGLSGPLCVAAALGSIAFFAFHHQRNNLGRASVRGEDVRRRNSKKEPPAGVQILASLDSNWTPRDLFRDVEARNIFVSLCFVGLCFGGPEGIRTLDLFHAMEARSQLRHRPIPNGWDSSILPWLT